MPTIRQSLDGILNQIDNSFEVVVVDQRSTDGSKEVLREYADAGRIKLFEMQLRNRGRGRQLAFEKSTGEYIIASVDLDIFYKPVFNRLLGVYRNLFDGKVVRFGTPEVSRRDVIEMIGGWRDLQWGEDIEHWSRAAKAGVFVMVTGLVVADWIRPYGRSRSRLNTIVYRYEMMRDLGRMGRHKWDKVVDSPTPWGKLAMLSLMIAGTIGAAFKRSYRDPWNNSFRLSDYTYEKELSLEAIPE